MNNKLLIVIGIVLLLGVCGFGAVSILNSGEIVSIIESNETSLAIDFGGTFDALEEVETESSFEFDNRGSYENSTKTMTVKNAFGLGDDILDATLRTKQIEHVGLGYVKVAEFEVYGKQAYNDLLNEINFYNIKDGMAPLPIDYDLQVSINKSFDYVDLEGNTKSAYAFFLQEGYEDKKINVKKDEQVRIEIWTTTSEGDYVEWIPNIAGVTVEEWAAYSATGGTITTDGAYTVHTFTSNGTFTWTGSTQDVSILVIAGGGAGGGAYYNQGGGGAGGVIYRNSNYSMSAGAYDVTVGLGGTAQTNTAANGNTGGDGQDSVFDGPSTLTAVGGGGGGHYQAGGVGNDGGSGGGAGGASGAAGGNPTAGQGNAGGTQGSNSGGGGGGIGTAGNSTSGGAGQTYNITNGTDIYYAGGGGCGIGAGAQCPGGVGGGGRGGFTPSDQEGVDGSANTGGGGGGCAEPAGATSGAGGSGIVIIRYLTAVDDPPTYSLAQTNTTAAGAAVNFSILYNDSIALDPNGQYIFSTNNTGEWVNDSAINFTSTPEWANVSKVLNSTVGMVVGYRWYATNNATLVNNTEIYIVTITDDIPPTYSLAQTNTTGAGKAVNFSILYDDETALNPNGLYVFSTNNTGDWVNESAVNFTSTPEWANVSKTLNDTVGMVVGYRWYANDSAGNNNNTPEYILTITDEIPPIIIVHSPTNTTYTVSTIWFNATASEAIDTWIVNYNGTNATITINTTLEVEEGNFQVEFWANDSSGNFGLNDTVYFNVSITDITPPYFITIPANASLNYTQNWTGVYFDATDAVAFDTYDVNDSRFIINSTGYLVNASALAYGNYLLNISINDTAGNTNATVYHVQINQSTDSCQVYFNETSPLAYPNIFTAMTNCTSAYTLRINDTIIANNSEQVLPVGAYNFSVFRTDNINYSNIYDEDEFQITAIVPSGSIAGTSPITYPTEGDVEGTESNSGAGDVVYSLYRNGSSVSNPDTSTLAVGFYHYIYNNTAGANYTANASLDNFNLTINQNTTSCSVYFNETSPLVYPDIFTVFTDCTSAYTLRINDTVIANNSEQVLPVGAYNFSVFRTDNENYSNIYDEEEFQISKGIPGGSISGTSPITYPTEGDVQGTESNSGDGDIVYSLYRNGTSVSNPDTTTLAVGFYNYVYNSTAGVNYTANASIDNFNLTINQNATSCGVYFNETSPSEYPTVFTVFTDCTSDYTLRINDTVIANNSEQSLPVGAYNFSVFRTDNLNYSNIYNEQEFQISKGIPGGSISGTSPITYPTAGDVTGTESNPGDGDVVYSLYRNGTSVSNPDTTTLAVGFYNYIYNSTEGTNYTANLSIDNFNLTINQNATSCGVYFNETSPLNYPNVFTAFTDCSSTYTLYRNGTVIANNSEQVLGVGAYNFSVIREDNLNYSNIYDEEEFQILAGSPTGTISGTSPITYPTAGDVTGAESNPNDGDVVYSLYRNGTQVSNPDTTTLAANFYHYIYNSTAGANYTANASLDNFNLTVNQNTTNCRVLFNETSPLAYPNIFIVLTDCSSDYTLRINDTVISNGSVQSLAVGAYNFSVIREDNTNYSNIYDEEEFQITASPTSGTITGTSSITYGTPAGVSGNESNPEDGGVVYNLYRNGTEVSNPDNAVLAVNFYHYIYNNTAGGNYSANASLDNFNLTINKATPTGVITGTTPMANGTNADITGSESNTGDSDLVYLLYRNDSLAVNPDTSILGGGVYGYIYNTTGGVNYTSVASLATFTLTVTGGIEYSDFTLRMVQILQMLLIFSMVFVVMVSVRRVYMGDMTLGEMFTFLALASFIFIIFLFLVPVAVSYIADLIW